MNRKQHVDLILRVLLMPFMRPIEGGADLLLNKLLTYRAMTRDKLSGYTINRREYNSAQSRLENMLEAEVHPERLSEIKQLLNMFYPEEELSHMLGTDPDAAIDRYYVERILLGISSEFVTLRDGRASIRMWSDRIKDRLFLEHSGLYKVELWSELSRLVTPDTFIAGYYALNGLDDGQLYNLPDNLFLSDPLMAKVAQHGVAETHMHLSAGMSYLAVWETVTDPTSQRLTPTSNESILQRLQKREQSNSIELFAAGWLRLVMALYLEDADSSSQDLLEFYANCGMTWEKDFLCHVISDKLDENSLKILKNRLLEAEPLPLDYLRRVYGLGAQPEIDVLLRGPYQKYKYLHTEGELLLLCKSLRHILKYSGHKSFTRIFLRYIRLKNRYFRNKLQPVSVSGLSFFRRYFSEAASAIRRTREDANIGALVYQSVFRSQFRCANLQKLEVKISPPLTPNWERGLPLLSFSKQQDQQAILEQLTQIFCAFLSICQELPPETDPPTLGIVYHFIKENTAIPHQDMCWRNRESGVSEDYVTLIRQQGFRFLDAILELLWQIPHLSEYIVGIDAASDELSCEPWVYAPVYRRARNRETTRPIQESSGFLQNIGLTYHVGEDYHHVLSGLRHIDEVLTHFGYKAGDRIGHGLALQTDLAVWINDHETVAMPVMEHMENLLWAWSLCRESPEELGPFRYDMEQSIMEIAQELYGNMRGITPQILWQAYTMKFSTLTSAFCEEIEHTCIRNPDVSKSRPLASTWRRSFCRHADSTDPVWDAAKLLMTHYCPIYTQHYLRPRFVSTASQLPLLQAVQNCVKNKLQQMGVYIETNPTSNLAIGDVSSIYEYPITKLNSVPTPSQPSLLVTINSDDPLVFNTNVENELSLIYHSLVHRGYSREDVLIWMDKVRQYGMDSSFIRRKKSAQVLQIELAELVSQFYRFLGRRIPERVGRLLSQTGLI